MKYVAAATEFGTKIVTLDVSDLPELAKVPGLEHTNAFSIQTFGKISGRVVSPSNWEIVFGPVNQFFATLTVEQQTLVAMTIFTIRRELEDNVGSFTQDNIIRGIQDLGVYLRTLNREINLCGLLKQYVIANIPIGDFSQAGRRDQDRPEYTIVADEAIDLLVIAVLCKMLTPLFGTIVSMINQSPVLDSNLKEVYTVNLLQPLFDDVYPVLIAKLDRYIEHTIEVAYNVVYQTGKRTTMADANEHILSITQRAMVYIKNLVNIDLYRHNGGNVVAYIFDVTRQSVSRRNSPKTTMAIRMTPDQMEAEGQTSTNSASRESVIESGSLVSAQLGEVPIIVDAFLDNETHRLLNEHELPVELYNDMVAFYRKHPFPVTSMNRACVNTLYSSYVGGSRSIALLPFDRYLTMVALVQLLAFMRQWPSLGHLVTAVKSQEGKTEQSTVDASIMFGYQHSPQYINCIGRFSPTFSAAFAACCESVMEETTGSIWVYNTADVIWATAKVDEVMNRRPIPMRQEFPTEFAAFHESLL